jgi:hypothetical protein
VRGANLTVALGPGTRFGSYEVIEQIGSGGMGEVYRATDSNLKRDVALKILPRAFVEDADRLARFQREAEILASLNHPNIATIHGLERVDDQMVIIMELVEGTTLADRIERGPVPVDDALGIASQIGAALEAAHAKGIVHRDLKPANVKLRPDDTIKVLDFGIAKALDAQAATGGRYLSLTSAGAARAGVVLGTAAYMSPEQARGKPVDKRADVWAFGCVLYEMLSGQPAFMGEDVTTTIARVLEREPDLSAVPRTVSPLVQNTLRLCLEKNPDQRIHDIGDVGLALSGAFAVPDGPASASPGPAASLMRRSLLPAAMLVAGAAIASAAGWWLGPNAGPVSRVSFADRIQFGAFPGVAVSRDGLLAAYAAGEPRAIELRRMDSLPALPVAGTAGLGASFAPCISPEGDRMAFSTNNGSTTDGALWKIPVTGGTALPIARGLNAPDFCDWGDDGYIYFGTTPSIMRVPEIGGDVEPVAVPDEAAGETDFEFPHLLPGGDKLLFGSLAKDSPLAIDIVIQDLETGARTTVLEDAGFAVFAPTGPRPGLGHLLYGRETALFAVPFNLATLEHGPASAVRNGLSKLGGVGLVPPSISDSGTLVWSGADSGSRFVWLDADGAPSALPEPAAPYGDLMFDAKRKRVAWVRLDLTSRSVDIWIYEFKGGPRRLTSGGFNLGPVWRSDNSIVYASSNAAGGDATLYSAPADGSAPATLLARIDGVTQFEPTSIAPDASLLVGTALASGRADHDVWILNLDDLPDPGGAEAVTLTYLLDSNDDERHPSISRDGRYFAYSSNRTGQSEIYVRPLSAPGAIEKVSSHGGRQPRWSNDGRTLYYISGNEIIAVAVDTDDGFTHGEEAMATSWPGGPDELASIGAGFVYDVASDGERFLVLEPANSGESAELRFELNWFEELRRLAPYPDSW